MDDDEDKSECQESPLGPDPDVLPEQQVQEPAVKGIYLRRPDFAKHGWTEGCAKCRFMLLHPNREGGPVHSDACKGRIISALRLTPEGLTRVQHAERRQNEHIAKHIKSVKKTAGDEKLTEGNSREERLEHEFPRRSSAPS